MRKEAKKESEEGNYQLIVKYATNKIKEETTIDVVYSDCRIILAFPAAEDCIETLNFSLKELNIIQKKLSEAQKKPKEINLVQPSKYVPQEEKKIEIVEKDSSNKLQFNCEITNIEIWLPRSVKLSLLFIYRLKPTEVVYASFRSQQK